VGRLHGAALHPLEFWLARPSCCLSRDVCLRGRSMRVGS